MHNFFFSSVTAVLQELDILISMSDHNMRWVEANGGPNDPRNLNDEKAEAIFLDAKNSVEKTVSISRRLFSSLKSAHIDGAIKRLEYWTRHEPLRWSELNTRARGLRDTLKIELREYLFYQYPREKGKKFEAWKADWKNSLIAFPEIKYEVFAATDCYALQHNTASVFHSMRIAEYGLRAIAAERRLRLSKNKPVEWATWQDIINSLDAEIKTIAGKPAGRTKDAALGFYSGARADLNGFKDEYRNLVMHVRAEYDEFQALRALTNVNHFLERLATRIDSSHKRIRWGKF